MAPRSTAIFRYALLIFFTAAAFIVAPASSAPLAEAETCVPSLQRMLSCLDFIEHRSDEIPLPCCIEVNATVAQQPCCLMHVLRGDVAKLLGPDYDNRRAMVDVTTKCLGDVSILVNIRRNCSGLLGGIIVTLYQKGFFIFRPRSLHSSWSLGFPLAGKPLPPLTPEFTFTTSVPPPPSSSGEQSVHIFWLYSGSNVRIRSLFLFSFAVWWNYKFFNCRCRTNKSAELVFRSIVPGLSCRHRFEINLSMGVFIYVLVEWCVSLQFSYTCPEQFQSVTGQYILYYFSMYKTVRDRKKQISRFFPWDLSQIFAFSFALSMNASGIGKTFRNCWYEYVT